MLWTDRDALICDLAETYHVLDYRTVPVGTLATLCAGLHDDSRIKLKIMNLHRIAPAFVGVRIADTLTMILHCLAGSKKKPKLYQEIMSEKQEKKKAAGFATIEEFEEAMKRITKNV